MTKKQDLAKKYQELHPDGNRPLGAWDEDELQSKIDDMGGDIITPTEKSTIQKAEQVSEEKSEEKTYKLTEQQLKDLMSGNQSGRNIFEADIEPVEEDAPKPRKYTCTVALYQKDADSPIGVVTNLKTIRRDKDPETKLYNIDIIRATITYDDDKTENVEYPIGDHIKIFTMKETVDIIKEDRKKMKMDKGQIYKTKTKKVEGINTRMDGEKTDQLVPMRERFIIPIITIKRGNGKIYTLPPSVINI